MKQRGSLSWIIAVALSLLALVPSVSANTNVSFSQGFTFTNAYGLRVPLGFESVLPPNWAFFLYNAIFLGLLFFIGGFASQRGIRFSIMAVDIFAAIFWWFGWASLYQPATDTVNWQTPLSLIILAGVMGGAIYLKEANKERYGTGGTGLTLINALYFFILLQTAIGFVNMTGIWGTNSAVTPTAYQYNNVDLQAQVTSNANTGGFMGGLVSTATGLGLLAIQSGQMILTILQGIVGYDAILLNAFPWITMSTAGVAFIQCFRIVILLLDAWFIFMIFFKPPLGDSLGA